MAVNWRKRALCARTGNAEAFFPLEGEDTEEAKTVCKACPVSAECLAYALERQEPAGIWGGKTSRERWSMIRKGHARAKAE